MGARTRAAGLVVLGVLVGYLAGPTVVQAAGRLVTIEGAGSTNQAKVTNSGRLAVDTEAVVSDGLLGVFSPRDPAEVIASGESVDSTINGSGVIVGVLLDSTQTDNITRITDANGLVWAGGFGFVHTFDALEQGFSFVGPLTIDVPGETAVRYVVYGYLTP
jgi:hypothetical protein